MKHALVAIALSCALGALGALGCASSPGTTDCDPAAETCACGDGLPQCPDGYACSGSGTCEASSSIDAGPDGAPRHGFGEPCSDRTDCESNICILVGTSGVCTDLCSGDDCPVGFGCFGVIDSVEPGQVDDVCVPTSSQLCSPCVANTECTIIGVDLCVANDLGESYCARDCSTVECPSGYSCETVNIGGTDYDQCIPNSGYCDCSADNLGLTQGCTIDTPAPFSTMCDGTRTCGGDLGWGNCLPPSTTDDPDIDDDTTYADSNCDGIDGDVTRGIFVSTVGSNSATCGLTTSTPCQTIAYGVTRAAVSSRPHVFVQTGTYNEVVPLVNGISIYGGYGVTWQRGPYSTAAYRVTIIGRKDDQAGGDGEFLTIRAHGTFVPLQIDNLVIQAPTATEAGKSSYAVHASAATGLTLSHVSIVNGNGAAGTAGGNGFNAVSLSTAASGIVGGNGNEYSTFCDNTSVGVGGDPGTNSCSQSPSSRNMNGGRGGNGGEMDDDCSCCSYDFGEHAGDAGSSSGYGIGAGGAGGPPNAADCNNGNGDAGDNGGDGTVTNGNAGGGAGAGGALAAGYWYANGGGSGGTGSNGSGGGGGGGSGGCDDNIDAYGAGGGGGGAGGCAARGGGGGGSGGGGSFGVFAVSSSTVTLSGCAITRASGGAGGPGGTGGRGQPGGSGLGGGSHPGASAAGTGGDGAHGGHGGGGGGGSGGRSIGIVRTSNSTVSDDCSFSQGAGGGGGVGGVSAPAVQGTSEDDGFDGSAGVAAGVAEDRRTCGASSC